MFRNFSAKSRFSTGSPGSQTGSFTFNSSLDQNYLNNLYEGDYEYAADMFETFLNSSLPEFSRLRSLIEMEDFRASRKLAHKLKPTLGMVGLVNLQQKMLEIENLSRSGGDASEMLSIYDSIECDLDYYTSILQSDLERMQSV